MKTLRSVIDLVYKNSSESADQQIRVLHVDDEPDFLKATRQILELHGMFQVETASSVKEAIQKLEDQSFDVIVSDYQLPKKDGMSLLKELRESGNSIPFILFTGKGREEVAIEALNLGADYYFNKSGKTETVYGELAHGIRAAVKAKKAEEQVKESEMLYRLLTENITDTIFIQDMNLNVKYVSQSVEKISGYTPEEILNIRPNEFMTPKSFERGVADFTEAIAIATKNPDADIPLKRYEYMRKDGSTFWGELKTKVIQDSTGRLVGLHGTLRDITERKNAEDALRKEREMLELVTTSIGSGLTIVSKDYKILWTNKFLRQIFGDIIGKTCYSVYNGFTSVCPDCGVKELFETGKDRVVHEKLVPSRDGKRAWIELTAHPIKDEKGNIIAASEVSIYLDEHKQMERKLREAEKRYRMLFDKAPLGILIIDSTGNAVEFNDEAHHQLGYTREEFAKLNVSDYEVLESPEDTKARIRKILKVGKDAFETKHRTKNGEIRDIINTVQVIELDGKQFFYVITRDITEQKKIEKRLDDNIQEKNAILNAMSELVIHQDLNHKILWTNSQAAFSAGTTNEKIEGNYCHEIWGNSSKPCVGCPIEAVLKTGQLQKGEIVTPDGRLWSITGYPIKDKNGNLTSVVEVTAEITEQKKTENALRESEAKYRELINGMNDIVWVVDFAGNFLDANDAAVEVLGYSREELLSMGVKDIDFNMNPKDVKILGKDTFRGENPVFETIHTTKDGTTLPVEISSTLIIYAGKQAFLCIARDISERKKAEESLDKMMKKLVTINEKLDAVGKLTRHDARNKLAVITNKVYLVKQQLAGDHNALEHLDDIESALDQIEQIFSFARTYEMVGAEELSYMDVKRFVDEAAILFSGMNRVKLVNECCGLTVLADLLLWQLFYNLIDNSLKHGEKVTQIRVYYKEEDAQLKLIYEDNGVGIPDDEKEKVFMEHYGKGTGYGLYLIRKMCDAYGWTIKETGTPGKGAQFTMTLPGISKDEKTTYSIDS